MSQSKTTIGQRNIRSGLRRYFIIGMILVAIVPPTVLSFGLYYFNIIPLIQSYVAFNKNMLDQVLKSEQIMMTQKYADKLNMFFKELEFQTSVLASAGKSISVENRQETIQYILDRFPHIRLMHSEGDMQIGIATAEIQTLISQVISGEIPLRNARNARMKISDAFSVNDNTREKLIFTAISGFEDDEMTHVFMIRLPSAEMLIEGDGFEGSIIILNENGRPVIQSDNLPNNPEMFISGKPPVKDFYDSGKTGHVYIYRGRDNLLYQGVLSSVDYVNWALITQRKPMNLMGTMLEMESEAKNLMSRLLLAAIIGVLSVGLLAGSVGALVALRFTRPLQRILQGIHVVAAGDYSYRFDETGLQDLNSLVLTLNGMIDSIQTHTRQLNQNAENMKTLFLGSVSSLIAAIDAKDPYTKGHSRRVQEISVAIGEKMGLNREELEALKISALMHDIGKIGISDKLLRKQGLLSTDERIIMESHPLLGADIMQHIPMFENMLPGLLHHHERWNGEGYPHKLVGSEIPVYGRIIAVADTFDAMTSDRPYQDKFTYQQAHDMISGWSGVRFDPVVIQAFIDVFERVMEMCRRDNDADSGNETQKHEPV